MDSGLLSEKNTARLLSTGCTPGPSIDQICGTQKFVTLTPDTKPLAEYPLLSDPWSRSLGSHLQENMGGIKVAGVSAWKRCEFGHSWVEEGHGIESLLCRSTLESLHSVTRGCSNYHLQGRM